MNTTLDLAEPEQVGLSSSGLAQIDRMVNDLIEAKVLPGAVTLVARNGKIIHRSAQGFKDLASGEKLSFDSIFRIYSMTKPVTAAAMMILYDKGLWSPDDPIAKHLPEFADVKGPRGSALDHPPTLRELMTHTAGFGYGIGLGPHDTVDTAYIEGGVWQAENLAEMARRIAAAPLAYQPGKRWRYSLSMDLQGAIIEKLSGQSLPDFMRTRIFAPLGLIDTDFHVPAEKLDRLSTVYHMYGATELTVLDHPGFVRDPRSIPKLVSGGGGLYSTASDYVRFAQMLLGKGELGGVRVLTPRGRRYDDGQPPVGQTSDRRFRGWRSPNPAGVRLRLQRGGDLRPRSGRLACGTRLIPVGRCGGHVVLDRSGTSARLHRHDPAHAAGGYAAAAGADAGAHRRSDDLTPSALSFASAAWSPPPD